MPRAIADTLAARKGARWKLLFRRGGYRVFVDLESLERDSITRAIVRYEYGWEVPARDGWPAYRSALELRQFDLAAGTSGIEQSIVFEAAGVKGSPARAEAFEPPLERPPAGTVGAAVIEALQKLLAH